MNNKFIVLTLVEPEGKVLVNLKKVKHVFSYDGKNFVTYKGDTFQVKESAKEIELIIYNKSICK